MVQFACTGSLEDINQSVNGSKYLVIKVFNLYTKEKEILSKEDFIERLDVINPYKEKEEKEVNKKYNGYIYVNLTKVVSIKNKETREDIKFDTLDKFKGKDIFLRFMVTYVQLKGNTTYYFTPLKDVLINDDNKFNGEIEDNIDNYEFFNNL